MISKNTNDITNYKGLFLILAALMAFFLLIEASSAELVTSGSALDASLLYYQPVPAQPGDLIDVWVQITNDGGDASKSGIVTFFDSGPFKIEDTNVKKFPPIPGGESFLMKTRVRISKYADEGSNNLRIRVQEDGSESWIDRDLSITIVGRSSSLSITSVSSSPEEIVPGGLSKVAVTVKNIGETDVRNVGLSLSLENFAPISGSNSETIKDLNSGEEYTFRFNLASYPDTEPKAYQIPVTLSYDDEQGNSKTQSEAIGLVVGDKPDLIAYFDNIGVDYESKEGDVSIRFVNKGLSEIKFVTMEVLENDNIKVTSESPVVYVGNIDADDYETASVSVKSKSSYLKLPIRVTFKDSLNRNYSEEFVLEHELRPSTGSRGGTTFWIIGVLIVAGILFFWFRKRKK